MNKQYYREVSDFLGNTYIIPKYLETEFTRQSDLLERGGYDTVSSEEDQIKYLAVFLEKYSKHLKLAQGYTMYYLQLKKYTPDLDISGADNLIKALKIQKKYGDKDTPIDNGDLAIILPIRPSDCSKKDFIKLTKLGFGCDPEDGFGGSRGEYFQSSNYIPL